MFEGLDLKIVLGVVAAGLSVWSHFPYMVETARGINKPHLFSWILWSLLTGIAYAAQVAGGAGAGAWSTGITLILCFIITYLAYKHSPRDNITKADWVMFGAGVASIPAWLLTSNALYAVLIVTVIDALAFGPTFRKSWHKPFEENSFVYGLNIIRHLVALAALVQFNLITALYPVMLLGMNIAMYAMLKWRRVKTYHEHG